LVDTDHVANAFPLVFVVFLGVAGVFGYLSWQAQQKRMKEIQLLCLNRGWTYAASDPSLTVRWNQAPFGQGDSRQARNVMGGEWQGRPFTAFDYSYVTESTDSDGKTTRTTHRFGVVRVGLPAYLPNLQVTDQSMFRRMAQVVGLGQDIELESEDFNRAFTVTSRDPKFASDVLNPRTMQMLLAAPHLAWRIEATDILSWDSGQLGSVQVLQRLDHLSKVIAGVPSFVWHDHGYDPGQAAGGTGGGSAA
jgi:hypothetical protein